MAKTSIKIKFYQTKIFQVGDYSSTVAANDVKALYWKQNYQKLHFGFEDVLLMQF